MTEPKLKKDVFVALAAVAWADGTLDPDEADAIVRTALEEGLDLDEIAAIEQATQEPLDLSFIDRSQLTKADRLFIYAVAAWMTRLDGVVHDAATVVPRQRGLSVGRFLSHPGGRRAYRAASACCSRRPLCRDQSRL